MDYRIFNEEKKKGWAANKPEEFQKWMDSFKEWYKGQTFRNDEEKNNFNQQIVDLKTKKEAFFSKTGGRAPIVRNNYILRENEGKAFEYLCYSIAAYFDNMNPNRSFGNKSE